MRRVTHILEREVKWPGQPGWTKITHYYWCGRVERYISGTLEVDPISPEEEQRLQKEAAEIQANPLPVCKKCRAKKDRNLEASGE